MSTITTSHGAPLVLELARAWKTQDDKQIADALRPIVDDRHVAADALLTLVAMLETTS